MQKYGQPLGLFQLSTEDWHKISRQFSIPIESLKDVKKEVLIPSDSQIIEGWIEEQIQFRKEAREKKDFRTADRIREELTKQGIILEDRPDGTTRWKR
jgi:cysteinyl-tRNA synthetase